MGKKLYFKTSPMGGGKTLDLIRVVYNYKENGLVPICFKPSLDTRSSTIQSRTGLEIDCELFEKNESIVCKIKEKILKGEKCDVVIIDESQFMTYDQVFELKLFALTDNIPVICYGLKTDFSLKLFEGSQALIELSDDIEEFKSLCWCGRLATCNARIDEDGVVARKGEQTKIGGNDTYKPLCFEHYIKGEYKK